MAKRLPPAEPIETQETVLYCSICKRRMRVYCTHPTPEYQQRHWKCPTCGAKCTGKTIEFSETWRRH